MTEARRRVGWPVAGGRDVGSAPAGRAAAKVERVVSPGGIEAYLLSEPSIPFLSLSLQFRGGAALDPAGKEGLAYMISGLLDEGAGDLDSQAFRTELEDLAIRLSFDAGRDELSGQLKTLTEQRERAFELLGLALTAAALRCRAGRADPQPDPGRAAPPGRGSRTSSRACTWFETAFPGHPYGRPSEGTLESIAAITTDDLRGFVGRRLARDDLVVGVAGDITAAELGPLLDRAFGRLPATQRAVRAGPRRPQRRRPRP